MIDKGNFSDNSFNDELLQKIASIIKQSIQSNCANLMEVVGADQGAGRQLLWLPKDKNCYTLYEKFEQVDKVSIETSKKKLRI